MNWAVFLDRDGVLTEAPIVENRAGSPRRANELVFLPGCREAVAELRGLGALIFVVTNQPDIARGNLADAELTIMHERLRAILDVDDIATCPHDGADGCHCRKPAPGMLVDLAETWDVDLSASWMVGDRWVDIGAGSAAGTCTILVERRYSWAATSSGAPPVDLAPDHRVDDFSQAVGLIARMSGSRHSVS